MLQRIQNLPRRSLAIGAAVLLVVLLLVILAFAWNRGDEHGADDHDEHGAGDHEEPHSGPHGGRLLARDDVTVELAISEHGVAPRFRAWVTLDGEPVEPQRVELEVEVVRLGGERQRFVLAAQHDYLESPTTVDEPHSFDVTVTATLEEQRLVWTYPAYEGRVLIPAAVAAESGLTTVSAGPAIIDETIPLYGVVKPDAERIRRISARHPGQVREVLKRAGDSVRKGDTLAIVESNESLQAYAIRSPIDGVLVERHVNSGEVVNEETMFTVADTASVWIELQIFHRDIGRVKRGQAVLIGHFEGGLRAEGRVSYVAPVGSPASQSVIARVLAPNADAHLMPGLYVTGEVVVATHAVSIAVPVESLQTMGDQEVVFEQIGDSYEVRMPEFGRRDGRHVEVKSGLSPGARVAAANSYLVKADIEKSGASHDH